MVGNEHSEAVLILGGVQEIAHHRTRSIRVAQRFALQCVDPGVEYCFIGIASQVCEKLEEYQRLIVMSVNHTLVCGQPREHSGAAIGAIFE